MVLEISAYLQLFTMQCYMAKLRTLRYEYVFICNQSISLPDYLSVCLSFCLSLRLSVYLFVCLSVCLSIFLSVSPSVCLSFCLSLRLSVYLFVCPSVCLSSCLVHHLHIVFWRLLIHAGRMRMKC